MIARVELRDVKENKVMWANPGMTFAQEYEAQGARNALDPTRSSARIAMRSIA